MSAGNQKLSFPMCACMPGSCSSSFWRSPAHACSYFSTQVPKTFTSIAIDHPLRLNSSFKSQHFFKLLWTLYDDITFPPPPQYRLRTTDLGEGELIKFPLHIG
uniref:Uncharacterized protein n=1 Tax=Micrurus surinamensis TaxID=129470 RepID=A0A2D4PW01_MICSU